jgi:hypothetical protein
LRWTADPSRTHQGIVRDIRRSASRTDVPLELTMIGGGEVYAEKVDDKHGKAHEPFLHVFVECENLPMQKAPMGLTAQVRLQADRETLGSWLKRKLLSFYHTWRMS